VLEAREISEVSEVFVLLVCSKFPLQASEFIATISKIES
jgi:hypothetical protein